LKICASIAPPSQSPETLVLRLKDDKVRNIKDDTQKIIEYSIELANELLVEFQEFFPFAVAINLNGEIVPINYFDGNDHPDSTDLLNNLETLLDEQLSKNEKRAYAITYDVRIQKNSLSEKVDAIAIKIKQTETKEVLLCYFAYKLVEQNRLEHLDSWREVVT